MSLGALLGWLTIPLMSANMDVLFRSNIPISIQGRIYSVRNALQFFTISLGYLLGGILVDNIFEPFMAHRMTDSIFISIFGSGKGSGAELLYCVLGILGVAVCIYFRKNRYI